MNRKRKTLSVQLLSLILCTALLTALTPAGYAAVSQAEIEALRAQRDEIERLREEKQAEIDELKENAVGILVQKRALDERNTYTMQQLQLNEEEIRLYDEMIADKEKEVLSAQQQEQEQLDRYRARVRAMEENGTLNYLALILKSNDLGEMLTAMDDVGEIMLRDKALEDSYVRARENTEEIKAEYEAYQKEVGSKQDALRIEQEKLQAEIDEASELLLGLKADYDDRQAEIAEIAAQEDATNMAISVLVAKLEAERAAAAAAAAYTGSDETPDSGAAAYSTGSFIFPVASYTYISSRLYYSGW